MRLRKGDVVLLAAFENEPAQVAEVLETKPGVVTVRIRTVRTNSPRPSRKLARGDDGLREVMADQILVSDERVIESFQQVAPDLAAACRSMGEKARIHVDDAADTVYNHIRCGGSDPLKGVDIFVVFAFLKGALKKWNGGRTIISL